MIIGRYEGYTITVSNPENMEKVKRSWLGYVVEDQERYNDENKESSNNNSSNYNNISSL